MIGTLLLQPINCGRYHDIFRGGDYDWDDLQQLIADARSGWNELLAERLRAEVHQMAATK
jgi:hypothetical protein